jgi:multidrug efflux pump subunit AcrB
MLNLFYRNRQLLLLTLALIMVWGLSSFFTLPRLEDPELVQRVAVITTRFPGASADRVETLVTDKLETELAEIQEINVLESTSRVGLSTVIVELGDTVVGVDEVWSRVRDRIDDAQIELPPEALEPDFDISEPKANALILALEWQLDIPANYAILGRLVEQLEDQLRQIPGTSDVEVVGAPEEEIVVEIEPATLTTLGLDVQTLSRQVAQSDAKVSAGQLRGEASTLIFEVTEELDSLERIRRIPIQNSATGLFTRLGDIAQVSKGVVEPAPSLAIVSGYPAVTLSALVESSQRLDLWSNQAQTLLEQFRQQLPRGIALAVVFDQSTYVEARLNSVLLNLLLAVGLVVGITLVLMGWQSALVVGSAIPLALLMVFGGMKLLGIPLHQMSVTGLIIALGLLIDNAIVMVDEVRTAHHQGQSPEQAVAHSVQHLAVPLLASSLTTVFAFLPIALAPGGTGEFTGAIAISVILAILSSLFLALTVVAALAALIAPQAPDPKGQSPQEQQPSPWQFWRVGFSSPALTKLYRWCLQRVLSRPWLGIGLALVVPILGFVQMGTLAQQFFPPPIAPNFISKWNYPSKPPSAKPNG